MIAAITGTILYKVIITPIDLSSFDFSDLLSLILAIFSIGLSVMFYIKADETSNRFYDNTQKFTQNISEILGRIEAGFGERLKHIDEGYNKLEGIYMTSRVHSGATAEIEKHEEKSISVEKRKDELISELFRRSNLDIAEKKKIEQQLAEANDALQKNRLETARLRREQLSRLDNRIDSREDVTVNRAIAYFRHELPSHEAFEKAKGSIGGFREAFQSIKSEVHPDWLEDLRELGWLDSNGELSDRGVISLMRFI